MNKVNVVFISGFGFKASIFDNIVATLPKHYCFKIINLNTLFDAHDPLDYAANKLNELIAAPSVIIGWSLGGTIASYFGYKHPNKVKQLITIGSTAKFLTDNNWSGISQNNLDKLKNKLLIGVDEFLKRYITICSYPLGSEIEAKIRRHVDINNTIKLSCLLQLKLIENIDIRENYREITAPTLHILAVNDAIVPVTVADEIKKIAPEHQLEILNDLEPHAMLFTHAAKIATLIKRFIEN